MAPSLSAYHQGQAQKLEITEAQSEQVGVALSDYLIDQYIEPIGVDLEEGVENLPDDISTSDVIELFSHPNIWGAKAVWDHRLLTKLESFRAEACAPCILITLELTHMDLTELERAYIEKHCKHLGQFAPLVNFDPESFFIEQINYNSPDSILYVEHDGRYYFPMVYRFEDSCDREKSERILEVLKSMERKEVVNDQGVPSSVISRRHHDQV